MKTELSRFAPGTAPMRYWEKGDRAPCCGCEIKEANTWTLGDLCECSCHATARLHHPG